MLYTIYKLCCDDTDKFYVGSTRNRKERVRKHRNDSKVKDSKVYQTIREFGGWDNWRMVTLEECECFSKRHAESKEEEWRVFINLQQHRSVDKQGRPKAISPACLNGRKCFVDRGELRLFKVKAQYKQKMDALQLIQKRWREYLKYGPMCLR